MQADCPLAQRPTLASAIRRSILGDQSGQDRNLIVQTAGEMRLCFGTKARRIAGKSGDGAAAIAVFAMRLRQIRAYVTLKSGG